MSRSKVQYNDKPERNYGKEALDLVAKLRGTQIYDMYEIVSEQLKRYNNKDRDNELKAVKMVIENTKGVDRSRLSSIWNGYKSEMARTANPKDGNTRVIKKK